MQALPASSLELRPCPFPVVILKFWGCLFRKGPVGCRTGVFPKPFLKCAKRRASRMTLTEQKLKTLVLGPQDHRSTEMLDILGQPAMVKLAGSDTNDAVAVLHVTVPKMSGPPLHRHSRE